MSIVIWSAAYFFWPYTYHACFEKWFTNYKSMVWWKSKPCLPSRLLPSLISDDDHWVIDTDYDNYAVHYSCRLQDSDGTCLDSYSFIFSRHPTGLRPEDQVSVHRKKMDLCLLGKYRRVSHTGELTSTWGFFVYAVDYWSMPWISVCK